MVYVIVIGDMFTYIFTCNVSLLRSPNQRSIYILVSEKKAIRHFGQCMCNCFDHSRNSLESFDGKRCCAWLSRRQSAETLPKSGLPWCIWSRLHHVLERCDACEVTCEMRSLTVVMDGNVRDHVVPREQTQLFKLQDALKQIMLTIH